MENSPLFRNQQSWWKYLQKNLYIENTKNMEIKVLFITAKYCKTYDVIINFAQSIAIIWQTLTYETGWSDLKI